MIVERHYDDEALIAILGSEGEGKVRDPHLAVCSPCAETLSSYRAIADVLGSEAVWDLKELKAEPRPDTLNKLRAFEAEMQGENQSAEDLLKDLLSRPRTEWLPAVRNDERFVQAGVARILVEKSEAAIDQNPPDAAALVRAAVDIAERLDSQQLRGFAWRQYAQVLFYTGEIASALDAVDFAQSAYEKCAVADYNLARVGIVRALIFSAQDRFDEASVLARESARTFRAYGDRNRVASAMSTEAYILMRQLRYNDAVPVLLDLARNYSQDLDGYTRAMTLANLGVCYKETLRIPEALGQYQLASELFNELGIETEAIRVKGHVAELLAAHGQRAEAKVRLRRVIDDFERLEMRIDAALAGISLVEILVVENAGEEVDMLCRRAIDQFRRSGVPQINEAMVALSYLQEVARDRRATVEVVRHVKNYIEKLPSRPNLLFAPLPLPPQ